MKKYIVTLTAEERQGLLGLIAAGKAGPPVWLVWWCGGRWSRYPRSSITSAMPTPRRR